MSASAAITGVICTRNRPEPLARLVSTLLAGTSEPSELLVVDQSDEPLYQRARELLPQDVRLRHVRSVQRGKGKALNEALRLARGTILVCTDDDCQAPRNWMSDMARALESQPTAALAFCQVLAGAHDRGAGYVPAYRLVQSRMLRSIADICGGLGLGAGIALRRDLVQSLGGFDDSFGPGGRFPSADEWDLAIRSLLRGWHVFETAELSIVHNGFRTFEEGRAHSRRDWIALGAVCAKPLRAGHWKAAVVPAWLFSARAVWPLIADALALRKPRGAGRIAAFLTGFAQGLRSPVETETLRFR
jgi:glycosyltransferase involved in cell wall biosynthesis